METLVSTDEVAASRIAAAKGNSEVYSQVTNASRWKLVAATDEKTTATWAELGSSGWMLPSVQGTPVALTPLEVAKNQSVKGTQKALKGYIAVPVAYEPKATASPAAKKLAEKHNADAKAGVELFVWAD